MRSGKRNSLAEEIRQTKPFVSAEQEAYLSILRTASQLSLRTDRLLKSYGLTQPQYNVLRILRGAGAAGLGRNQIGGRLVTAMPDVSRLLDRMEASGWITRERSAADKRTVATSITPDGARMLKKLDGPLDELVRGQFEGMGEAELQRLLELLATIRGLQK